MAQVYSNRLPEAGLVDWSENFVQRIINNAAAWQIPAEEVTGVQTAAVNFKTLHAITSTPARTKILVAEKNAAKKVLLKEIRSMVNFRLKNPIITDAELIALGLNVSDKTKSPIPVPPKSPKFYISLLDSGMLSVGFQDQDSTSKARPYGINGAVISYAVLETAPTEQEQLIHSVLATKTPHTLVFTAEERGKTVYIAVRWQNIKGQTGPWSNIETAIVP